jgi:hypothetical protein
MRDDAISPLPVVVAPVDATELTSTRDLRVDQARLSAICYIDDRIMTPKASSQAQ